jgi:histone-binding protein RBBP4
MTSAPVATAAEDEEQAINDDYKIWKKNSPFLYDLVMVSFALFFSKKKKRACVLACFSPLSFSHSRSLSCPQTHALDWPSLTLEWLPDTKAVKDKGYAEHRLVLGTHTSGAEQNYLMIAHVRLPLEPDDDTTGEASAQPQQSKYVEGAEVGGFGRVAERIEVRQRINHDGEVNRARHMPQNPNIVATKSPSRDVLVFDITKHPSHPEDDGVCRPELRLTGHTLDGYGLAWSPRRPGVLLSGSDDATVCLWDTATAKCEPLATLRGVHTAVIEDVAWHASREDVFATVGDDKLLLVWDMRALERPRSVTTGAHGAREVNAVAFNPFNEFVLATGGSDKNVALWDLRNMAAPVASLRAHKSEVFQVAWSRRFETVLASSGTDRRVMVWDISRIGDEQTADEAEDGPPELLFIHGGHTSRICEFSWNPNDPWVIASVADDNILQIWQVADHIITEDNTSSRAPQPTDDLE